MELCLRKVSNAIMIEVVPDILPPPPLNITNTTTTDRSPNDEYIRGFSVDLGARHRNLPPILRDAIQDHTQDTGREFELEYTLWFPCPELSTCLQLQDTTGDFHISCVTKPRRDDDRSRAAGDEAAMRVTIGGKTTEIEPVETIVDAVVDARKGVDRWVATDVEVISPRRPARVAMAWLDGAVSV